jgi:hypothetical protein
MWRQKLKKKYFFFPLLKVTVCSLIIKKHGQHLETTQLFLMLNNWQLHGFLFCPINLRLYGFFFMPTLGLHGFYLMPNNLRPCGFYLMPSNLWLYGSIWCPYLGAICGFYLLPNKLRLYGLFLLPNYLGKYVAVISSPITWGYMASHWILFNVQLHASVCCNDGQ